MVKENRSIWQRIGTALRFGGYNEGYQANPNASLALLDQLPSVAEKTGPVDESDKPRKIEVNESPIGSSGVSIYGGYYDEEYLASLRGTAAADAYDKMRRSDGKIKMCVKAVQDPIMSATWEVRMDEKAPPGDAKLKSHVDLIEHVLFHDMETPWARTVQEALSMVWGGYVLFEITDKAVINHPRFGSYSGLHSLGYRSQRTIERWHLDPNSGKLMGITQYAYGDIGKLVTIPSKFLVHMAIDQEGDNYEGISMLRPCFGPWSRKQMALKLMAIGMERSAIPTPVADVPVGLENSTQFTNLVAALKAYTSHQSNYMTKPAGWPITFLDNPFDPEKIKSVIEMENSEIVFAFMANFLLLGMGSSSGSFALGYDLRKFFMKSIQHVGNLVCAAINQTVIPRMVQQNFGAQQFYPKLACSGVADEVGEDFSIMMKNLVSAQVIQPDDDLEAAVRKRIGIPAKTDNNRRVGLDTRGAPNPEGAVPQSTNADQPQQFAERRPRRLL